MLQNLPVRVFILRVAETTLRVPLGKKSLAFPEAALRLAPLQALAKADKTRLWPDRASKPLPKEDTILVAEATKTRLSSYRIRLSRNRDRYEQHLKAYASTPYRVGAFRSESPYKWCFKGKFA